MRKLLKAIKNPQIWGTLIDESVPDKINKKISKHKKYVLFILLTAGTYFVRIFSKIIFFKSDGLYAGHPNVWGDWALHITLTNTFANKPLREWFLYHPCFSGGKLTYPFLTNAFSGLLMKMGFDIAKAMIWPSIVFILLFLVGMYFLYYKIIKSRKTAILGIFIFLTSAGPGFIRFFKEFYSNPNISMLTFPPIDYTRITDYQWLAGNIPTAILIPQRAFLIGITIGTWALLFLINGLQSRQSKLFIVAGVLAGILPIAHIHSFIAIVIISGFICLTHVKENKKLLYFVVPAGIISSILYFQFIHGGIQKSDFMTISLGWTSKKNILSWIVMWWRLWGIMIPLAIYSLQNLYRNKKTKPITKYFYGFFALFVIANIIIFQPTAWDNTKLFAWVYFGFSLLAAHTITKLWKHSQNSVSNLWNKNTRLYLKRIVAILLLITLSTTGILELIRLQRLDKNTFLLSKTENIIFAQYVRDNTNTDDIFLTATNHNHYFPMWGSRSIVLGYKGWIANFGFDIWEKNRDIINIFQKPELSLHLIKKYDIDYIVIGDLERAEFEIDQNYFEATFPVAFKNGNTTIYSVKQQLPAKL